MQYFPDNKTSNFVTKLSRTLQLDGEREVGLAEIDYPHTWYNICEGKNSVEIYAPGKLYLVFQTVEYSIQPGYYEKVQDVIDALYKAGLANLTDVLLSYDDTFKRVIIKCGKDAVVKLRGDIARMFGFLNNTTIRASDEKGFTLALPETGNQSFYVYTDIIKSQYHGDFVVPVLHTVTVKGEHGSYVSKNFERSHYVPLNKKIFDTISINIGDEVGDAFEHGKVILHYILDVARHSISFEMVLPLIRLNSIGYDNKPHNAWEDYYYAQVFLEEYSVQIGGNVPFYRGPVLQRGYGIGSIFKSVARSVMPSLKEIVKSALTTGLEVLNDVAKGENIKTAAKKRLKENSLVFLDDTVSRIASRKSIKGSTNKQIIISSSKPKKRKH